LSTVLAAVTADEYRRVLGHFCTGVTVVTAVDDGVPVGFACQAFAALSLDPPMVLFCPGRASSAWAAIERAGHFCVNVLAEEQRELSRAFGRSGDHKYADVRWTPTAAGAPVLAGVLTWIACDVVAVHEAGDHFLVVGRVTELGPCRPGGPLLFYRSRYGSAATASPHEPPEVVDTLLSWGRHDDWI